MKKIIFIFLFSFCFLNKSFSNEKFSNWIESLELKKPIFQDSKFFMGVGYTAEPIYLKDIFAILVSFIYDEVYSDDKRYVVRSGCKPKDCGNKGMLWIDLEKKVTIGVIDHSFWEKLDFKSMINDQIFIFSTFYESTSDFPDEFKISYSNWLKENEIIPSKYRFLNSKNKLLELDKFK